MSNHDNLVRFQREAQMISRLDNPHIVRLREFASDKSGLFFLVMEYVEGESLAQILQREGRLSMARMIPIMEQVCQGLAHAHKGNVLHRDIKPRNIMIANGTVKILDFGIAKPIDSDMAKLTSTGQLVGSPL